MFDKKELTVLETQASSRAKMVREKAITYDDLTKDLPLATSDDLANARIVSRQRLAKRISEEGDVILIGAEEPARCLPCSQCGFSGRGVFLKNIVHYVTAPGTPIEFDPQKGYIAREEELKRYSVHGIFDVSLHQVEMSHAPKSDNITLINSLFGE